MDTLSKTKVSIILTLVILAGATAAGIVFSLTERQGQRPPSDPQAAVDYFLSLKGEDYTIYTDPDYGFSFAYPRAFGLSRIQEGDRTTVLVENPSVAVGFRITVMPLEGTSAELRKSMILPALAVPVMRDVVEFKLNDEISALRFSTRDPSLGNTRELWFIRDGRVYRITMYAPHDELLDAWIRKLESILRFAS